MSSPRALSTFPSSSVNVKNKQMHKEIHIKLYPHYMVSQSAFVEDISRENSDCKNVICVFRYFSSFIDLFLGPLLTFAENVIKISNFLSYFVHK